MVPKIDINTCPEFGVELALVVPYAYWLHQRGMLGKIETSVGMKPFYFFHDDVAEIHTERSIDNNFAGLSRIPNNWIHHNALSITGRDYSELSDQEKVAVNGVLDYSQWVSPPYNLYYNDIGKKNNTVIISNKYNIEHGESPLGFFNLECIYEMVQYLTNHKYRVIYKRHANIEVDCAYDQNEKLTVDHGFTLSEKSPLSDKIVTDIQFIKELKVAGFDVTTMDDVIKNFGGIRYNIAQASIFAKCNKFISVSGGNAILSSLWGGDVIVYVHKGKEMRENYFGDNSYFRRLSGANVVPAYDHDVCTTGVHNYDELYDRLKRIV